ncbi:MAG: hydrogenase maturation protease [Eggerthellaceae bacterium]|nr:hydrogenase maturation protease [Eggerthellaceae bacterium]
MSGKASAQHISRGEADVRDAKCAIICVGNKLMLDEGIGPAVYEALIERYEIPDNVSCFDVGCMSLDMLPVVRDYDFIVTVDAVDGTGEAPGTVFRFSPDDVARHTGAMASLHDMKLIDLFDSAALLGYEARGVCLGMQVLNMEPAEYTIGLTEPVYDALPLLIETVEAELYREGFILRKKDEASA